MILDKDNVFAENLVVSSGAIVTSAVDLGVAGDAIGQELTFHNVIGTAFAGGSSVTPALQTSPNGSAYTTVLTGKEIVTSDLKAGKDIFCVRVPQGLERYVRMSFTVAGSMSAGTITSFMSKDL